MEAESDGDDSIVLVVSEKTMVAKIGSWVNPTTVTASVLISFGTYKWIP